MIQTKVLFKYCSRFYKLAHDSVDERNVSINGRFIRLCAMISEIFEKL